MVLKIFTKTLTRAKLMNLLKKTACLLTVFCTTTILSIHASASSFDKTAQLANNGDIKAQYELGNYYRSDKEGNKDYSKAIKWYLKAANQGDSLAQLKLAEMYHYILPLRELNRIEAIRWYQKAADQGLIEAQYNLGFIYYNGQGVKKNYNKAFEWYLKAAEQGDFKAQSNIGAMYRDGEGVSKNREKAIEWFEKSANQGYAAAQYQLALMYDFCYTLEPDFAKASKWYQQAAEQNYLPPYFICTYTISHSGEN